MIFGPIYLIVSLSIVFHLAILVIVIFTDELDEIDNKQTAMLLEGIFDMVTQFYMYFMAPIQIARIHRLTQEVTPAGTIISLNMIVGVFGGTMLQKLFNSIHWFGYEVWLRVIALALMCLALGIIWKRASEEWKLSR